MIRPTLALAAALLAAAPLAAQHKPKEPVADGHPLSYWIREFETSAAPISRSAAAYTISSMGSAAAPAVPALIAALADTVPNTVRYPALVALREIGPPAKAAIPRLDELLGDRNDEIVHAARKAIKRIEGDSGRTGY